jgi:hypothetical protein
MLGVRAADRVRRAVVQNSGRSSRRAARLATASAASPAPAVRRKAPRPIGDAPPRSGTPAHLATQIAWRPAGFDLVAGPRHLAAGLLSTLQNPQRERSRYMNENDHPKGALLFMLVYLALLVFMWTNLYLKLWTR